MDWQFTQVQEDFCAKFQNNISRNEAISSQIVVKIENRDG